MVLFISAYYPESSTLQQLINQSVLGQGRSLLITQQVLWAVLYLHSQEIIHKDIKPDNILMLPGDRALLIDFGLATQQTETFQADEALKGTECYMAPEIAGGQKHDGRVDVWSTICTLLCMISGHPPWSQRFKGVRIKIYIIAMSQAPLEDIPPNAHPRMRRFLQQTLVKDFLERPTAAQALELLPLDIVEETFNCLAVAVETEAESEPMEVSAAIPDDVLAGPLTPWTPRGPEDGLPQFPPSPAARPDSRLVENEMSLSHLFISPEDREEQRGVDASGADEDMYGPPSDVDGPEIFNDGAIQDRSLGSRSGTSSVGGRKLPRQPSCNAANFDLPWPIRGDFGGASQAAASFMQDEPANPSGTSAASASFELQPMSLSGSSRDFHSISTAHARIAEAGWLPSLEGIPRDEPDIGGAGAAAAIDTSGVDTNSPRHSAEDMASVTDTAESVSSAISFGSVINIYAEGARLMRMKVDLDFTARQLVKEIVRQPDYLQSKLKEKEFTLCWQASQGAIDLHHTFGRGEHHVVAVATSAVGVWLWRSNCNGQITLATQAE
ncbi:serine/threonine-protein kinase pakG-like [Acanthaster planci]|uniref:Serine/threonine-protein kinase pakG-like n=1 Tax=Acanthaster planci TaxID=133434 RepID=A0A8B7Z066_ACAPL|nr:serine/threonine-protein kinase pakG-like [Acanthaster planci]